MKTGNTKVMNRFDVTSRLIAKLKHEEAVIGGIGNTNFDLWSAGHRPQNFYTWGNMGVASSIGVGLALARPDLRVYVLDGDGSLLMNLGSLATVGLLQPANLILVVLDNEAYATTGGQPTPTAHGADLAAAARAMRIDAATIVRTESGLREAMKTTGPSVIVAKVQESAPTVKPPLDYEAIRDRFMAAIA